VLKRRQFLGSVLAATAAQAAAPPAKTIALRDTIPTVPFGKTGHRLPILAFGGSAMVGRWSPGYGLPARTFEQRVSMVRHGYEQGIRYFDTSRNYSESESIYADALKDVRQNIYLSTKVGVQAEDKGLVEPSGVRRSIEDSLRNLKTDYVDCIQLHGPVFEYLGYDAAMRIYEELAKLRSEKLFRFIGVTGHTAFEPMYRLIDTKLFDQVLLAYGYFPKGMNTMLSQANLEWRELCMARARELGMGVLAMKVMGSFLMGHNAANIVPGFGDERYKELRRAALRWALRDRKPDLLVVGVSLPSDVDENIETLGHAPAFTRDDQKILADFSLKALRNEQVKSMKVT
jgi:aryl-alcohol dehydrogenase-like predicted oxidoreductase